MPLFKSKIYTVYERGKNNGSIICWALSLAHVHVYFKLYPFHSHNVKHKKLFVVIAA